MTNKTPELDLEVPLLLLELELEVEVELVPLHKTLLESPTENPDPIDIWR